MHFGDIRSREVARAWNKLSIVDVSHWMVVSRHSGTNGVAEGVHIRNGVLSGDESLFEFSSLLICL